MLFPDIIHRTIKHSPALINHKNSVTERLGLFHNMRGEDYCFSSGSEFLDSGLNVLRTYGIKPIKGLIKDYEFRLMNKLQKGTEFAAAFLWRVLSTFLFLY